MVHPRFDFLKHLRRILAFAHQHDALDDLVVVVAADETLPRHRAVVDFPDVAHEQRRAVVLGDNDRSDVGRRAQEADAANQVLLLPFLEIVAAGVGVAARQRGEHLLQRHAVRFHTREIDVHLVLLDEPAAADDVRHARRHLQRALDDPVLDAAQLGRTRGRRFEAEPVQLADRRRQRRQLRLDVGRQAGLLQPFEHALSREIVVDLIVESERQKRQPELRVREHPHRVRHAGERDLERNRDLLLDFFRRMAGKKRDHRRLHVGDVGKRLHRQRSKRHDPGRHEQHHHEHHEQRLIQRERDEPLDHQPARLCSRCRSSRAPSTTTRSPGRRPASTRRSGPSLCDTSTARRANVPLPTSV